MTACIGGGADGSAPGRQEQGRSAEGRSPLPPPAAKAQYVREMFERIARQYDRMNRLMTVGRDRAWRRHTVAQVAARWAAPAEGREGAARRVLDVATGTGELALEALAQEPALEVVGVDFSPQMLALAQDKVESAALGSADRRICLDLVAGDALQLPFADATFDAIVTGFALRNVTDIPAAFAEMSRVTRRGGRLACLEISKPRLPIFRQLFAFYFYRLVPLLGRGIAREDAAYTYLPHSLTTFLTPEELAGVIRRSGWRDVRYRRLTLGAVAVHVGVRE
jgi:demethylmenaquinone methyltransferase / 2-methoxy-6-polyprenyl-1,4-benzoquinol methylase